jgi:hypothetical protein
MHELLVRLVADDASTNRTMAGTQTTLDGLNRIRSAFVRRARAAEAGPPPIPTGSAIMIRLADRDDEQAVDRLAQLSELATPVGACLVGEVDGRVQAALAGATRELLRDPFIPTAEVCSLLMLRAAQLDTSDPAWASSNQAQVVPGESVQIVTLPATRDVPAPVATQSSHAA